MMGPQSIVSRALVSCLFVFCSLTAACLYEKKVAPPPAESVESGDYFRVTGSSGKAGQEVALQLAAAQSEQTPNRKLIRNGALDLVVKDIEQANEKVRAIVDGTNGYVESSTQSNTGVHTAKITVRIPAAHLDQAMSEIKKLSVEVERENVEVRDVTREYIDLDARLRNAQAEETQYLQILKRATTVKDTLDVTEKLSNVRGRIEQLQGEMKYLTTQIDMSALEITLRPESQATVMGIHWRPLTQAKIAFIEMVSGLADWVDAVISFFINLPLIIVWVASIFFLVVVTWRILRFIWRKFGFKTNWRLPWRHSRTGTESNPS